MIHVYLPHGFRDRLKLFFDDKSSDVQTFKRSKFLSCFQLCAGHLVLWNSLSFFHHLQMIRILSSTCDFLYRKFHLENYEALERFNVILSGREMAFIWKGNGVYMEGKWCFMYGREMWWSTIITIKNMAKCDIFF